MAASPFVSLEEDEPDSDQDDCVDVRQSAAASQEPNLHHIPLAAPAFSFSHVPPAHIRGTRQWPGSHDSQSHSTNANLAPTLFDVWVNVQSYLVSSDRQRLSCTATKFSLGVICSPLWLTRPWQPHQRRHYGFGSTSKNRSATTDIPTLLHVVHQLWPFLDPIDRQQLQQLSPSILRYSFQRIHAVIHSVAHLRQNRPPPTKPSSIDQPRTRLFGSVLLRFDFIYGDMVRWLSGEYTNRHRNWTDTFQNLQQPARMGRPRGLPPADFPRA